MCLRNRLIAIAFMVCALIVFSTSQIQAQNQLQLEIAEEELAELNSINEGWFFYPYFLLVEPNEQLEYLHMSNVVAHPDGTLAIGGAKTNAGDYKIYLFRYMNSAGEWVIRQELDYGLENGEGIGQIRMASATTNNTHFVAGYSYYQYIGDNLTEFNTSNSNLPEPAFEGEYFVDIIRQPSRMILTSAGRLIIGTGSSLAVIDHENSPLPEFNPEDGFPTDRSASYMARDGDYVWLHTHQSDGGLFKFHEGDGEWEHFTTDNSDLPSNYVNSVVSRDGVIWVSTVPTESSPLNGGLVRIEGDDWTVFDLSEDLNTNNVRVHAIGNGGEIYAQIGPGSGLVDNTHEGGLAIFDGQEWNSLAFGGQYYSRLGDVDVNNNNIIWMAGQFNVLNGGVASLSGSYVSFDQVPDQSETWASGYNTFITWSKGELITTTTLSYSTNQGSSWNVIEAGIESTGLTYEFPSGNYETFRLRIEADNYGDILDETGDFAILDPDLPYYHVRNLSQGRFEFFDPGIHGWGFENGDRDIMWIGEEWADIEYEGWWDNVWQGRSWQFPPFYALDDAFGTANTRTETWLGNPRPTYPAGILWTLLRSVGYNGVCHGFAVSSSIAFSHGHSSLNSSFGAGISADTLYNQEPTQDVKNMLYRIFTQQWGRDHLFYNVINSLDLSALSQLAALVLSGNLNLDNLPPAEDFFIGPNVTLDRLKEMMESPGPGQYTRPLLLIPPSDITAAHSVFPYKLEQDEDDSSIWYVYIYENNAPGATNRRIIVNTSTDSWQYEGSNTFFGNTGLILGDSAQNYRSRSDIFRGIDYGPEESLFAHEDYTLEEIGYMHTLFSAETDLRFENEAGNVTQSNNLELVNNIPGALPIIPAGGGPAEMLGLFLIDLEYDIELDYRDDEVLGLFSANQARRSYNFYNYEVKTDNPDRLRYGNSITVFGKEDDPEFTFMMDIFESLDDDNLYYRIENFTFNSSESVSFNLDNDTNLEIRNLGGESEMTLQIGRDSEQDIFFYQGLELNPDYGYKLLPDWSDVSNPELQMLIDTNLDGEYDQSQTLIGMDVSIPGDENGSTGQLPREYQLHHNYPNPFNPATTIEYSLPESQHVQLEVYNMLGQRVAVLVNEVKTAGRHQAVFDATNLSSGMYLYRITAGSFVQTEKMMLVK